MNTYFEKYNSQTIQLFDEIRTTLKKFEHPKAALIPSGLYNENEPTNIAFAGQYSAGKSSLLTILTGKKLSVGGGITTDTCQSFDWNGVRVIDTPGIHTQDRPDHDATTYEQLAKADLIVFVLTAEGFSSHLANHFRKLINEKGKGNEMMLVINKMDRTAKGNTAEQQEVLIEKDILPVISPYSAEEMYTSFISTNWYNEASAPENENYKDELILQSGIKDFIKNFNQFTADKKLLGRSTTALYEVEKILEDIEYIKNKNDETIIEGALQIYEARKQILEDTKIKIKEKIELSINKECTLIQEWGNNLSLNKDKTNEEINKMLSEKQKSLDEEINKVIQDESKNIQEKFEDLKETISEKELKIKIEKLIENSDISKENFSNKINFDMTHFAPVMEMISKNESLDNGAVKTTVHSIEKEFIPWQSSFDLTKYIGALATTIISKIGLIIGAIMYIIDVFNQREREKKERKEKKFVTSLVKYPK